MEWGKEFSRLLEDALKLDKQERSRKKHIAQCTGIIQRLERLLEDPPDTSLKELHTFYKSMVREQKNLFTFLYLENVPPDNNASERAVRNVKVKQKYLDSSR